MPLSHGHHNHSSYHQLFSRPTEVVRTVVHHNKVNDNKIKEVTKEKKIITETIEIDDQGVYADKESVLLNEYRRI